MLDLLGDLYLVGFPFYAHIIAIRTGHSANVEFGKKLLASFEEKNIAQEAKC